MFLITQDAAHKGFLVIHTRGETPGYQTDCCVVFLLIVDRKIPGDEHETAGHTC